MLTKLAEITEVAKHRPKEKFTSLAHLINVELLRICHNEMDGKKAVGIDKVTKEAYSENLEDNLADLIARMKRQAYHPQPVRRVHIPKPGSDRWAYYSRSKYGNFVTKRKTSAKKYKASLLLVKQWIQENRHHPKSLIMETLERKLRGYYQYYGVMENRYKLKEFYEEVKKHLFKNLNRRSQKRSYTWDKFILFIKKYPLPKPKVSVSLIEIRPDIGSIL